MYYPMYYPKYMVWIIIIHYWIPYYDCRLGWDQRILPCSHMLVAHVFMGVGLSKHGVGLGSFGVCVCVCMCMCMCMCVFISAAIINVVQCPLFCSMIFHDIMD